MKNKKKINGEVNEKKINGLPFILRLKMKNILNKKLIIKMGSSLYGLDAELDEELEQFSLTINYVVFVLYCTASVVALCFV